MLSCLTEFNEEVFRKGIHEEGFAEGRDSVIQKLLQKGMSATEVAALLDISLREVNRYTTK